MRGWLRTATRPELGQVLAFASPVGLHAVLLRADAALCVGVLPLGALPCRRD